MKNDGKNEKRGSMWARAVRSALAAAALSVALVAGAAFVLMKQWLPIESAGALNTVIKIVCAAIAALLTVCGGAPRAWLWGAVGGLLYMLLTVVVFSLISGEFSPGTGVFADIIMCLLAGAVTGIVRNIIKG